MADNKMALEIKSNAEKITGNNMKSIQKILKKSKRNVTSSDRWMLLGNVLSGFGVQFSEKKLSLPWGTEEEPQYELLSKMFNSLLNVSTEGAFNEGTWNVQA